QLYIEEAPLPIGVGPVQVDAQLWKLEEVPKPPAPPPGRAPGLPAGKEPAPPPTGRALAPTLGKLPPVMKAKLRGKLIKLGAASPPPPPPPPAPPPPPPVRVLSTVELGSLPGK
ncbi:MAG TPA: hypothetical protein VFF06_00165, partial [Polyangia bacterium]|nr:hypothetical protein [Polyangia bacterium]